MKKAGVFFLWGLSTFCTAQNTILLTGLNHVTDKNSCYQPTPAVVKHPEKNQVLFQSTDGGTTWTDLSKGVPDGLEVSQLVVKNNDVYISTLNGKLYHTTVVEKGTWDVQNLEGKINDSYIINIIDTKKGLYTLVANQGLFKQVKGTDTWKHINGELSSATFFMLKENSEGDLLAACDLGIFLSKDEGLTWKQSYSESWANSIVGYSNVWLAYSAKGIIRSVDNGHTWSCVLEEVAANFKLDVLDGYFVAMRQTVPYHSKNLNYSYLTVSKDEGATWTETGTGKPTDQKIFDLEKMDNYLFSSRASGISRSSDMGNTWQLLISTPYIAGPPAQFEIVISNSTLYAVLKRGGC